MMRSLVFVAGASLLTWGLFGLIAGVLVGGIGLLFLALYKPRDRAQACTRYGHDYRHLDGRTCVRCGHVRQEVREA